MNRGKNCLEKDERESINSTIKYKERVVTKKNQWKKESKNSMRKINKAI